MEENLSSSVEAVSQGGDPLSAQAPQLDNVPKDDAGNHTLDEKDGPEPAKGEEEREARDGDHPGGGLSPARGEGSHGGEGSDTGQKVGATTLSSDDCSTLEITESPAAAAAAAAAAGSQFDGKVPPPPEGGGGNEPGEGIGATTKPREKWELPPDGWFDYPPCGDVVANTRLLPCKTLLDPVRPLAPYVLRGLVVVGEREREREIQLFFSWGYG